MRVIGLAVSLVVSLVVAACSAHPEQLRMREEYERALLELMRLDMRLASVKRFESESNSLTIECLYENASGKDIRLFTGILQFSDSFDRPIFQSYRTIAEPIRAGETAKWVGQVDANRLVTPQIDRIVWRTRSIVHADGTIVGASNAAQ